MEFMLGAALGGVIVWFFKDTIVDLWKKRKTDSLR